MDYRYASKVNPETEARALGRDLSISTKQSVEICNLIRGRDTDDAKKVLEDVIAMRRAVPYKRFYHNVGHKRGPIAAGRYPRSACKAILDVVKLVEANAQNQGLTGKLTIRHLAAHMASRPMHYGRHSGLQTKRTHIEIIVTEEGKSEKKESKKEPGKPEMKVESKKEGKK